jgi:Zn-finger nucleic acid-binding protein
MSRHHPGDAPRPCPSCRQRWLIQRDTGLYPIEVCPYCEGVWVERVVLIKRRYD